MTDPTPSPADTHSLEIRRVARLILRRIEEMRTEDDRQANERGSINQFGEEDYLFWAIEECELNDEIIVKLLTNKHNDPWLFVEESPVDEDETEEGTP